MSLKASRLLIPLILLLLGVSSVGAQSVTPEPDAKWWWAWRDSTHELIAFDAEGDTHVIATPDSASRFSRISDDTALAVLQTGSEYALYKLTSQSIVQLSLTFEGDFNPEHFLEKFHLLAVHWPYAIVDKPTVEPPWLINLLTDSIESLDEPLNDTADNCSYDLSGVLVDVESCLEFSADGHNLSYLTSVESGKEIALRERDLTTGQEHTFYIPPNTLDGDSIQPRCVPYINQWSCGAYIERAGYNLSVSWLVSLDGQQHPLLTESLFWSVWSTLFALVPTNDYDGTMANGSLLLFNRTDAHYLLLSPTTGKSQDLGTEYCCEVIDTESPDSHWIILGTDQGTAIWDLQNGQEKFVIQNGIWPDVLYFDGGFILTDQFAHENPSLTWVYFNGAAKLLSISYDAKNGTFVEILPNHTLLYEQSKDSSSLKTGIYRYDPAAKTYTPLVPGATFQFGY